MDDFDKPKRGEKFKRGEHRGRGWAKFVMSAIAMIGGATLALVGHSSPQPSPTPQLCHYNWSTQEGGAQPDPVFAADVQTRLSEIGIEAVVTVLASGENEICPDGTITVGGIDTRYLTLEIAGSVALTPEQMGTTIAQIIGALEDIGEPYPVLNMDIRFAAMPGVRWYMAYHDALKSGKTGADLFAAGGGRLNQ